jgi:hypothetical protein
MPSNFSLAVSSIRCPSTSMANWSVSLAALSSGWPTNSSLLLSPATHKGWPEKNVQFQNLFTLFLT